MNPSVYAVLNYAARYWFAGLAVFIVYRAVVSCIREYRIAKDIRNQIETADSLAVLILTLDPRGKYEEGTQYALSHESVVGSAAGCDIRLRHKGIGRKHAQLFCESDCVRVRPFRGMECLIDGTTVKGEGLVFSGGQVTLGEIEFQIEMGDER